MKVTIHQPDFLPWLGFFRKINKADLWIVLDHVCNNPRNSGFWGRRVRILVNGQKYWLSVPLNKPKGRGVIGVPIKEMTINTALEEKKQNSMKTIEMAYGGAPHFQKYSYLVKNYLDEKDPSLFKRNMRFIIEVMKILEIDAEIVYSSDIRVITTSNQMLVDILRSVKASTYVCGDGSAGYQQDRIFAENGIHIEYNNFRPTPYSQYRTNVFVPGLSVIDALFSESTDRVKELVKNP